MKSAFTIADRIAMLYEGRVISEGTPGEIKQTNDARVQQFLNGSPEGPIKFFQEGDDYLKQLTE